MIAVLQKYRMLFLILAILVLAAIIWVVILSRNDRSIPMRGVFVLKDCLCG
ncbi:hypothetical protein V6C42_16680 [Pseudoclostridium thermosuccinogenes]|uniref:hypothetical protein n=1 Tax=Clostridium thermosuccinogenes TaxID=84032 RepID=UPI0013747910|nr:hypothetical protein [Pseudoclostridium thermosuccinogenes]